MYINWSRGVSYGWAVSFWSIRKGCWDIRTPTCCCTVCDALLGAANMRDIGYHFPDTAGEFKNIDSKILLKKTVELIAGKGYKVGNIDATICAERPKLKAHIPLMQETMATVMGIDADDISIKATTTEKLGFTGREEGISAYATVLIEKTN